MADKFLTLLDLTKRGGCDAAVGLVDEVTTYAPEINVISGRPIAGTTFKTKVRTALPASPAFRLANEGVDIVSGTYSQLLAQCYFLDGQMRVDEAILKGTTEGDSEAELLADEASAVMRAKMIGLGNQFYNGTTNDAKGFPGLKSILDTTNMVVDATGSGASATYRAWFIWNHIQGVHFIFGNGQGINLGEWRTQQVTDANGRAFMAKVNNLSGWIGLANGHSKSIGCVKNITSAKPFTDALAAELLAKFPIGQKPTVCLVERNTAFWLQKSRSATSITNRGAASSNGADVFAPLPTEVQGVPIVVTDSIAAETNW